MHRTLNELDKLQREFIDTVFIQNKVDSEVTQLMGIDKQTIRKLYYELESTWRPITKIRDKWKRKKMECNFWDFYHWHKTTEACCHYCGVTQDELDQLHTLGIQNKRTSRGKTLEIDRKDPNESYSKLENLTYCCYWCNNAKTDTFTEEEFKIIGEAMGKVWKMRLKA